MENEVKLPKEGSTVSKKLALIIALALFLWIPLQLVESQIYQRRDQENVAWQEVSKGWGAHLQLASPKLSVLSAPVYPVTGETFIEVKGQEKKRGIFKVPVYTTTYRTKVSFVRPAIKKVDAKLHEHDALIIGVYPTSAIQSFKITEIKSGKDIKAKLVPEGLSVSIKDISFEDFYASDFQLEVVARGSGQMLYRSIADTEKVRMVGSWQKPKFIADILPSDSSTGDLGFTANWSLSSLPTLAEGTREVRTIGMEQLWIGTDYTMIERAVKYGLLFIALTFMLVLLVEFMSKAKIHPAQYGLIGLSISVFYLLLLAISESTGFHIAYWVSSIAVTGLIVFYVKGFLNQPKFVRAILIEQVVLSGFFYVLLSLEEKAFLVGTLGLFAALATFMIVTRKFDWYSGAFKTQSEA